MIISGFICGLVADPAHFRLDPDLANQNFKKLVTDPESTGIHPEFKQLNFFHISQISSKIYFDFCFLKKEKNHLKNV